MKTELNLSPQDNKKLANLCGPLDENISQISVGLDVNANHIRSVKSGWVKGIAKPISIGSKIHVWEIKITDEDERLTCISRLTVSILPKKQN